MNNAQHLITREIGIDMGHRVTLHQSRCRNLHGHRYKIEATCLGTLFEAGAQQGMVLDFSFLKDLMMQEIDEPCDHGMCFWVEDPWLPLFLDPYDIKYTHPDITPDNVREEAMGHVTRGIQADGYYFIHTAQHSGRIKDDNLATKLYVIPVVPTAENLAKHWFERLQPRVEEATKGQATLLNIKVWETPNCASTYPI